MIEHQHDDEHHQIDFDKSKTITFSRSFSGSLSGLICEETERKNEPAFTKDEFPLWCEEVCDSGGVRWALQKPELSRDEAPR